MGGNCLTIIALSVGLLLTSPSKAATTGVAGSNGLEQSADNGPEAKLKSIGELLSVPGTVMSTSEVLGAIAGVCAPDLKLGSVAEDQARSTLREINDIVGNTSLGATTRVAAVSAKLKNLAPAQQTQSAQPAWQTQPAQQAQPAWQAAEKPAKEEVVNPALKRYLRLSLNFAAVSFTGDGGEDMDALIGGGLSVCAGLPLSRRHPHFLEFGLHPQYVTRSSSSEYDGTTVNLDFTMLSIAVPICYTYRFNPGGGKFFVQPLAGLNVKFNPLCDYSQTGHSTKTVRKPYESHGDHGWEIKYSDEIVESDFESDAPDNKFVQIGARIGVFATIGRFSVGYVFQPDFNDLFEECGTIQNQIHVGLCFHK